MSTVLWANVLCDGQVKSLEADHAALYRHEKKLDALTRTLGLPPFRDFCDTLDLRYNVEDLPLPPGMTTTNELMAAQGAWLPIADALHCLTTLREHIATKQVRFGLLSNQQAEVLAELDEAIAFARAESGHATSFNFAVVM
mgnify:FL=1